MSAGKQVVWKQLLKPFVAVACMMLVSVLPVRSADKNPVAIGTVAWGRDLEAAFRKSKESGKPVFLLFQEVPGCSGCRKFGAKVLSNPLLVEAIETEFLPVVVYNNRKGKDQTIRKRFKEPAWNYQVVRVLGADGKDLIPRKDKVWTLAGIAMRMIDALKAAKRPVPKYLEVIAMENATNDHGVSAFAVNCFWTGEKRLGQVPGVIQTEAGWLDGREVTRVVYDKRTISLEELAKKAALLGCANKVYTPDKEVALSTDVPTGILTEKYRKAKGADQKKQISRWKALQTVPNLTPMQLTKINAFGPRNPKFALQWLSPRQTLALKKAVESK